MHRMTGYDAQFIYDESAEEPQHTLKLILLGPGASAVFSPELARSAILAEAARIAPLRWRVLRVPLDLYHPIWIDGGRIDADHHVRRLAVPKPGGRRELCEVVSEIAGMQLDPSKPLWEIWFLEGLEGGGLAALFKINHALADGLSYLDMLEQALSAGPEQFDPAVYQSPAFPPGEPVPSRLRLMAAAVRDAVRDLIISVPRLTRAAYVAFLRRRREDPAWVRILPTTREALRAPQHVIRGPLHPRRVFYYTTVPLADVGVVRHAADVTVNDVILATAAGALRRYLGRRNSLPDRPVLAVLAASTRSAAQRGMFGNRLTSRLFWLPTDTSDSMERLRAAHRIGLSVKHDVALSQGAQFEQWMEVFPPLFLKIMSHGTRWLIRSLDMAGTIVVSTVRGPEHPLFAAAEPLENFISVGHMKFVAGLNFTVWSYADKLNFGMHACRTNVPDPWQLADDIDAAFAELLEAARGSGAPAPDPELVAATMAG